MTENPENQSAESGDDVEVTQQEGLATVTLNRPKQLNAMTFGMMERLTQALHDCARSDDVRAVLLRGAGDRAFCAGYDLKQMGQPFGDGTSDPYLRAEQRVEMIENAILQMRKPVIAAVQGHAIGSGLDIVLSCDYTVVSESAKLSESRVFRANMATVHWLPLYVGWAKAKDMLYRGTVVRGAEAVELGLVNEVVPDDLLEQRATEVATEFAEGPTRALGLFKRAMNEQILATVRAGQDKRNIYGLLLRDTEDIGEAKAAFREKRKPRFTGR